MSIISSLRVSQPRLPDAVESLTPDVTSPGDSAPRSAVALSHLQDSFTPDPRAGTASAQDPARLLRSAVDLLGCCPPGLEKLSATDLLHLVKWVARGVRFQGTEWTGDTLGTVLDGLEMVERVFGPRTAHVLGMENGRQLHFTRYPGDSAGGTTYTGGRAVVVELWLPDRREDFSTEVTLHELGHVVDHALREDGRMLSDSDAWAQATGRTLVYHEETGLYTDTISPEGAAEAPTRYAAEDNRREDFAETFTWVLEQQLGETFSQSELEGRAPNPERIRVLRELLGLPT